MIRRFRLRSQAAKWARARYYVKEVRYLTMAVWTLGIAHVMSTIDVLRLTQGHDFAINVMKLLASHWRQRARRFAVLHALQVATEESARVRALTEPIDKLIAEIEAQQPTAVGRTTTG